MEEKILNVGDKAYLECVIDAVRTGLKTKQYRIDVNGEKMWVDIKLVKGENE